ncbi:unnamed protein product [Mytilus edulis]|uniref:PH domain-containing protein n=1 Tax=Mytilus edulis TaxID=6550 RepID=A0A8S3SG61_MYTED|nr:unnamed protein product [Mytilus edulis]
MMMNDLRPDAPNEDPTDPVDIALHIERRLIDDDVELRTFWQTVIPENLQPMSLSDVKGHPVNEIFRHQIVMEETTKISSLAIDHGKRTPIKIKKLQTKKGWDHEVYLFLGSEDEKYIKWGKKPHKMDRRIAYTDITDIRMVDMNDQTALILCTSSRTYVFKTSLKTQAMQWWLSIRERSLGKRTIPKDMKETAVKEDIKH